MTLKAVPTINVAISEMLLQWHALPFEYTETFKQGDIRLTISTLKNGDELPGNIINNRFNTQIDFAINNNSLRYLHQDKQVVIYRWNKPEQALFLHEWAEQSKTKYMHLIPTFTVRNYRPRVEPHQLGYDYPPGRYLVRPQNGARGIGQMIVDTTKIRMQDALNHIHDEDFGKVESMPEGINLFHGHIRHENEGWEYLKTGDYFIQKVVDNVTAEFRVVLGAGKIDAIFERPRETSDSSGSYAAVSHKADKLLWIDKALGGWSVEEILNSKVAPAIAAGGVRRTVSPLIQAQRVVREAIQFIEESIPHYNSVDLFVTADGRWGIFEFCNQFSAVDFKTDEFVRLMKKWLRELLQDRMDGK